MFIGVVGAYKSPTSLVIFIQKSKMYFYLALIAFFICFACSFSFCFLVWYLFQSINRYIDNNYFASQNVLTRLKKVEGDIKIVTDYVITSPSISTSSS